jgi:hypothetical protein
MIGWDQIASYLNASTQPGNQESPISISNLNRQSQSSISILNLQSQSSISNQGNLQSPIPILQLLGFFRRDTNASVRALDGDRRAAAVQATVQATPSRFTDRFDFEAARIDATVCDARGDCRLRIGG